MITIGLGTITCKRDAVAIVHRGRRGQGRNRRQRPGEPAEHPQSRQLPAVPAQCALLPHRRQQLAPQGAPHGGPEGRRAGRAAPGSRTPDPRRRPRRARALPGCPGRGPALRGGAGMGAGEGDYRPGHPDPGAGRIRRPQGQDRARPAPPLGEALPAHRPPSRRHRAGLLPRHPPPGALGAAHQPFLLPDQRLHRGDQRSTSSPGCASWPSFSATADWGGGWPWTTCATRPPPSRRSTAISRPSRRATGTRRSITRPAACRASSSAPAPAGIRPGAGISAGDALAFVRGQIAVLEGLEAGRRRPGGHPADEGLDPGMGGRAGVGPFRARPRPGASPAAVLLHRRHLPGGSGFRAGRDADPAPPGGGEARHRHRGHGPRGQRPGHPSQGAGGRVPRAGGIRAAAWRRRPAHLRVPQHLVALPCRRGRAHHPRLHELLRGSGQHVQLLLHQPAHGLLSQPRAERHLQPAGPENLGGAAQRPGQAAGGGVLVRESASHDAARLRGHLPQGHDLCGVPGGDGAAAAVPGIEAGDEAGPAGTAAGWSGLSSPESLPDPRNWRPRPPWFRHTPRPRRDGRPGRPPGRRSGWPPVSRISSRGRSSSANRNR